MPLQGELRIPDDVSRATPIFFAASQVESLSFMHTDITFRRKLAENGAKGGEGRTLGTNEIQQKRSIRNRQVAQIYVSGRSPMCLAAHL